MTLIEALTKSRIPATQQITVHVDGFVAFSGSIASLKKNRKDILDLEINGEIVYKVHSGYFVNVINNISNPD